jgi:predicted RNA methylase
MNPRILELQHQAMSLVLNGNDPDGDVEKMYIPAEFTKKLAELIVLECVKIADDGCGSACFGLGINGAMLLQHFGVEE